MLSLVWYALAGRRCLDGVQAGYYWSWPWHLTALELLLQKNTTGAFLTNTLKHHILRTDHTIDNTTLDDAFKDWLNGTIGNTTLNDTVNGCLNGTFVLIDGPRSACVPAR
eukprot:GEMP01114218.1.p2 GENE.GEMP01114218.1~~GEMP01114218.1.p2  ORF type:complete len:110 (+),score=18.59 GEMP01114218.1:64-393(+)